MHDFISIGDATLDVFLGLHEANVMCSIHHDSCELCLNYAEKIPVESVTQVAGAGNASNCAIGASRLGLKSAIVSVLGNDSIARQILRKWEEEGVATDYVTADQDRATNYSTVLNFQAERTELVFAEPRNYVFPENFGGAKWLYYTSLGRGSESMHEAVVSHVKSDGTKLVFQPDTYQLRLGLKKLMPLLAAAEIVIMNKEEMRSLLGAKDRDIKDDIKELRSFGCRLVVITDGPAGSWVYDGAKFYQLGIFDEPVVEMTGAGDAYSVAFVAALFHGKDIPEAMRWGTANSASVIGYVGPQAGLLDRIAIQKILRKHAGVNAKEM